MSIINKDMFTVRDLMAGHTGAEIRCAHTGKVVRRLAVVEDTLDIDAMGEQLGIPLDTQLTYEPWFMDRGSILFTFNGQACKFCTEFDKIVFEDGTELWA